MLISLQRKKGKVYKSSIKEYNRPSEFAALRAQREIHNFIFLREMNEITDKPCQDGFGCNAVNAKVGFQYFHWHICNIAKNITYNLYSNQCFLKKYF